MKSQTLRIILAIIITAGFTSISTYYFFVENNTSSSSSIIEDINNENINFDKSSKEYAIMSQEFWSAIECSLWASYFDEDESERLFMFGYRQGKKFLDAVRADKISEEDWRNIVPIGVSMQLAGPSNDFILGVISASIQEYALDDVFYSNRDKTQRNSKELQKLIAENKYRDGNCYLLGK